MTPHSNSKGADNRMLGDLRIFQAIHNDLSLQHELVTDGKGHKRWAYVYDGVDPYELEDNAFSSFRYALKERLLAEGPENIVPEVIPHHNPYISGVNETNTKWREAIERIFNGGKKNEKNHSL